MGPADSIFIKIWKLFLKALSCPFMEKGEFSMGRTLLTTTFLLAYWKWVIGKDIPNTQENFLGMIVVYVLSGKVINGAKEVAAKWQEAKQVSGDN